MCARRWSTRRKLRLRRKPQGTTIAPMSLLEVQDLQKSFVAPGGEKQRVIDVPRFTLERGGQTGMKGASGQGKTTLLHLIAGILKPDGGSVRVADVEVSRLAEPERDRWRARNIGYIFQTFNLLPGFSCLENVLLAMSFGTGVDRGRAEALLRRVGLGDRLQYHPRQLSTGQQQRVAVARALANRPKLVLADEPTGNLDPANGREVLQLIREACAENEAALLMVTHDPGVLGQFETVVPLEEINRASRGVAEVAP
jgi:ABC-type lipoprotein export system ATPase subunit